jgi:hypothetical protein
LNCSSPDFFRLSHAAIVFIVLIDWKANLLQSVPVKSTKQKFDLEIVLLYF